MTTTDLERMTGTAIVTLDSANDALARLGQWVEAARNASQLVAALVETPFVPEGFRVKVDPRATPEARQAATRLATATAAAAVLQGITLGLDPLTALQQIYVVHGRPGMYAKLKVALLQSRGHEIWTEDQTDSRAVVCGRRKGSDNTERVVVTMEQARKAGWTSNQAYTKTPQDMLWARAAARVCDRIAADALMGIASVEEIQDAFAQASGNGKRAVTPPKRLAAEAEPPPVPEEAPAVAATEPEATLDEGWPDVAEVPADGAQ